MERRQEFARRLRIARKLICFPIRLYLRLVRDSFSSTLPSVRVASGQCQETGDVLRNQFFSCSLCHPSSSISLVSVIRENSSLDELFAELRVPADTREHPVLIVRHSGISLRFSLSIFQEICIHGFATGSCSEFRDILRLRMLAAPRAVGPSERHFQSGAYATSTGFSFLAFLPRSNTFVALLLHGLMQPTRSKIATQLISRDYYATM